MPFIAMFAKTRSREPDYYLIEESNANPRAWWQYTHRCLVEVSQKITRGHRPNPFPRIGDIISTVDGRTVEVLQVEEINNDSVQPA